MARWYNKLYKEFMLSLSQSFIDVQKIGNKKSANDLSNWAKKKAEKGGDEDGRE